MLFNVSNAKIDIYEHDFVSARTSGVYTIMYENVNIPKCKENVL